MEQREIAQLIKETWLETFPNGYSEIRKVLDSYSVVCYLKQEWINNIKENDPLKYYLIIEGNNVKEFKLHCLTIPSVDKNLVYETVKKRKQTIKNVNKEKLNKRFTKIKEWIETLNLKE